MTTNKPEVVAWLHSTRQDSDVITDKVRCAWGTPLGHMGQYAVPLVRLSDYEVLQAENERLRKDAERYHRLRIGDIDDIAVVRGLGAIDYGMSAVIDTYSEEIDGDDLDATIDAAMEKENEA